MADNVAITAGSGTNVATDERSIASVTVHVQRFTALGSASIANGQAAPTGTAGTLLAARETRRRMTVVNRGSQNCYLGIATVSTSNGLTLKPGDSIDIETTALVQAITSSGTGQLDYIEEYD